MAVCEPYIPIKISHLPVSEIAKVIGINICSIRIIDVNIAPGFKSIGTVIFHTTVTFKNRVALFHHHIALQNGEVSAVTNFLQAHGVGADDFNRHT